MLNSRLITDLSPSTQAYLTRMQGQAKAAGLEYGVDWVVISTYRDQELQDKLYAQGRTEPGKIVTWSLHSYHTSRKAFDVAIKEDGKIVWESPKYEQLAKVGRSCGLECGFFWKKRDPGHFQLDEVVG
jgi:peptidoglycan L-alanyl-D-glutamate endopeptidase CwlK